MRSVNDMKNYWGEYSKFGQHKQVTKNLTLNENAIITIKTSLIDQLLSGSDYKLHRTSCLSSNTKISDVPMMGNRVKGAGNGKRGKGSESRGTGKWTKGTKQRIGNENTDCPLVISHGCPKRKKIIFWPWNKSFLTRLSPKRELGFAYFWIGKIRTSSAGSPWTLSYYCPDLSGRLLNCRILW